MSGRRDEVRVKLRTIPGVAGPGQPTPVWGAIHTLDGPRSTGGFLDFTQPGKLTFSLEIDPAPAPKKPAHRPRDDGRRVAVALAFLYLSLWRGLSKTDAYEQLGAALHYGSAESGSRPRDVKRVLREKATFSLLEDARLLVRHNRNSSDCHGVEVYAIYHGADEIAAVCDGSASSARLVGWKWKWGDARAIWGGTIVRVGGQ